MYLVAQEKYFKVLPIRESIIISPLWNNRGCQSGQYGSTVKKHVERVGDQAKAEKEHTEQYIITQSKQKSIRSKNSSFLINLELPSKAALKYDTGRSC